MERSTIEELAGSVGIEPEFMDNWGELHVTPLETKARILAAMGLLETKRGKGTATALPAKAVAAFRTTEPAIVARLNTPPEHLVFRMPVRGPRTDIKTLAAVLKVTDEAGKSRRYSYTKENLHYLGTDKTDRGWLMTLGVPFPALDEVGYYRLSLSVDADAHRIRESIWVAMCPEKAYVPPEFSQRAGMAGISLSLYAVRSKKNWGVGDFGDLKRIIDWASGELQCDIIGLNPLHAIYNRAPFNTSPYLPISKLYRNFVYLDIPAMQDFQTCNRAHEILGRLETQQLLAELRDSEFVQYEKAAELKLKMLRCLFDHFLKTHWNTPTKSDARRRELEAYIAREGKFLENFATFCALDNVIHSRNPEIWTWRQWPEEYRRPGTGAVQAFKRKYWSDVLFYMYVQWQIEKQLEEVQCYAGSRGLRIGLYHDLALAIDRCGADCWAYQDYFFQDIRVGAPPDAFSQHGQDWGFPPPNMQMFKQNTYELFVQEIRKNCAYGGALRIDHVMRFFHLYYIPDGEDPRNGAYVSQPFEDLLGILALESVRNRVIIVGEDLGTVPQYIRDKIKEFSVLSYRLLYFEKDDKDDFKRPEDYPELALVTISTHDLPTLSGYWANEDIRIRKAAGLFDGENAAAQAIEERRNEKEKLLTMLCTLGLLKPEVSEGLAACQDVTGSLHNAIVGFLAMTPCKLFLLSQEDLFKDNRQQNLPGTTHHYPNWSIKMKYSVDELFSDRQAQAYSTMFRSWIKRSGRGNTIAKGGIHHDYEGKTAAGHDAGTGKGTPQTQIHKDANRQVGTKELAERAKIV